MVENNIDDRGARHHRHQRETPERDTRDHQVYHSVCHSV